MVRIGQPGALSRYALVSPDKFDDEVIQLTQLGALAYEMQNEDDHSPVTITIYSDKHIEADSRQNGHVNLGSAAHGAVGDPHRHSATMLAALPSAPLRHIPGVNSAVRVVQLPDAHLSK